jgi:hypothetical protein
MTPITQIPLPKKMRALRLDHRGYPVPFIVLNDMAGKPVFTANDSIRQARCIVEKRCPICGSRLDRIFWFVGGPLSAFHEYGLYNDSAMHKECMEYALRVCPYLAMRPGVHRVDPEKIARRVKTLVFDPTMIPGVPVLMVAVAATIFEVVDRDARFGIVGLRPKRPYLEIEYWRNGERIADEDGRVISDEALAAYQAVSA